MPTAAEFQELFDNCSQSWITLNDVYGILFTSNLNGHTLFFPAAGYYNGTELYGHGSSGIYWSSTYFSAVYAPALYFEGSTIDPHVNTERRRGFSVRAVRSA